MKDRGPLGTKVRSLREQREWSIREASEACHLNYFTIFRIENGGTANPAMKTLRSIAKAFGVTVGDLYTPPAEGVLDVVPAEIPELVASETPVRPAPISCDCVADDPFSLLRQLFAHLEERDARTWTMAQWEDWEIAFLALVRFTASVEMEKNRQCPVSDEETLLTDDDTTREGDMT